MGFFNGLYLMNILEISCMHISLFYQFIIPQTNSVRAVMIIHHIFCAFAQFPVYIVWPLQVSSALGFQCELSNIWLDIAWFGQQYENSKAYYFGGIGSLITYPITRIIIIPIMMYVYMDLPEGTVPFSWWLFACIAQWFVLIMSV